MAKNDHGVYAILIQFSLVLIVGSGVWTTRIGSGAECVSAQDCAMEAAKSGSVGDFSSQVAALSRGIELTPGPDSSAPRRILRQQRAEAFANTGRYPESIAELEALLVLERDAGDEARVASVQSSLGQVYFSAGRLDEASEALTTAEEIVRRTDEPRLLAAILNNLGNLRADGGEYEKALENYREAAKIANQVGDTSLRTKALINQARAVKRLGDEAAATRLADKALDSAAAQSPSRDQAYAMIGIGRLLQQPDAAGQISDANLRIAYATYNKADEVASSIGDVRAQSYAIGYLAELYSREGRQADAIRLSEQALFHAQQISAPELMYLWHWQIGRSYKAEGKLDEAIGAYVMAAENLAQIRASLSTSYRGSGFGYRDTVGPLFLELADLYLQGATVKKDPQEIENALKQARAAVEQLKTAELADYFLDPCVATFQAEGRGAQVDSLTADQRTAILYPILLPDRMEILVSLPSGIVRKTVTEANREKVQEVASTFRGNLVKAGTRRFRKDAKQLYEWLVRPLESELEKDSIHTIVIVPDGPLRTIPMAALYDAERKEYLVERYALATTPGLTLTDASPLARGSDLRVLLNGITVSVGDFAALPAVEIELQAIESIVGSGNVTKLVDSEFVLGNIEQELTGRPYDVVHIASHGVFEANAQDSFILTYDPAQRLYMDDLENYMSLRRFSAEPVELLTLSACETAKGDDDRAALGLSGIAIKSGARSALGTLWNVHDTAASTLVTEFYRNLTDPSMTKARALQQAQIGFIENREDKRFRHPAYWSPFLLIGNWL